MLLVQFYVPLQSARHPGARAADLAQLQQELTREFGGVTAFVSQPAEGLWQPDTEQPVRDSVVLFEVMVENLDRARWAEWRRTLEHRFGQHHLLIRAIECTSL
jgi:hypothetical protein